MIIQMRNIPQENIKVKEIIKIKRGMVKIKIKKIEEERIKILRIRRSIMKKIIKITQKKIQRSI